MLDPAAKIRRLSRVLMVFCAVGAVLVALCYAPVWFYADVPMLRRLALIPAAVELSAPGFAIRVACLAVSALLLGPVLYGLAQLWLVLRQFGRGVLFDTANVARLRRLGWSIMAVAVGDVAQCLIPLLLTLSNPPGGRFFPIDCNDGDLLGLFAGGVMLLIARVLDAAREISDDNAQII
jgi:hypothetical protein